MTSHPRASKPPEASAHCPARRSVSNRQRNTPAGSTIERRKPSRTSRDVFRSNAAVFDEMIVDDFYCFDEGTPEYRLDLLVRLIDSDDVEAGPRGPALVPAHYQVPQWYDRFHLYGYDAGGHDGSLRQHLGGHRNPQPGHSAIRATYGYVSLRRATSTSAGMTSVAGPKTGGAWFDSIDCTAQNYLDQAYQSVLAGARELTLFSLDSLMTGPPRSAAARSRTPQTVRTGGEGPRPPGLRHFVL